MTDLGPTKPTAAKPELSTTKPSCPFGSALPPLIALSVVDSIVLSAWCLWLHQARDSLTYLIVLLVVWALAAGRTIWTCCLAFPFSQRNACMAHFCNNHYMPTFRRTCKCVAIFYLICFCVNLRGEFAAFREGKRECVEDCCGMTCVVLTIIGFWMAYWDLLMLAISFGMEEDVQFEQYSTLPPQLLQASSAHTCLICFDDFKPADMVSVLPCKHILHKECASKWLQKQRRCAICTKPVLGSIDGDIA
jgi:hypothetical protein